MKDQNSKLYKLTENYAFQSPSYASGFVAGEMIMAGLHGSTMGKQWQNWKKIIKKFMF